MKKVMKNLVNIFVDCYKIYPPFVVIVVLLKIVDSIAVTCSMFLMADILEVVVDEGVDGAGLIKRIVLYGVCLLTTPCVHIINEWIGGIADVRAEKYFGNQLCAFSKKIKLEELENPHVHDRFKKADGAAILNMHRPQMLLLNTICTIVVMVVGCIGAMLVVGRYSFVFVVLGLFEIIPEFTLRIHLEKMLTRARRMQSNINRRCAYLWSLFTDKESIKEMRVMGFGAYLKDKWVETNTERVDELRVVRLNVGQKRIVLECISNVFYALNVGVVVWFLVNGRISVGAFAACLSAFANYKSQLQQIVTHTAWGVTLYDSVADYYDYFTIPTEADGEEEYRAFEGRIVAKDVCFRYCGSNRDALSDLNLEIKQGEHVVIVGENGSGKTTFSKLLTGAYQPYSGSISYDGQNTADLRKQSLYDHISVVSQDFVRYHFTLGENIGISDLNRRDSKAMEELLCEVAGPEFLSKVGGLDMQLGREFGGTELSGGEWQKVAIARGLWKDSDIIILDEPTSALDPLVEYDILSKFVEMIQNKTSVIISHRVGICRSADKIIVMKDGRAVECGRHEELIAKGGEYSHIWNEQAKWYEKDGLCAEA